ncbi:SusC/RagA family TonB-linked outer membrane protein [Mucilaginibacter lacusdianchii]|uniref:SusC/RagA family TonB-linked outer membrane protein n=1 Tax=Mucilaginibacter lacusdianchii TaxID=2684211 RepID=UPI00131AEC05|nr:SusC/RagA family TonB-linked outer membrane protein [Mucilaginibacter sp. JXJ CY 39]
MYSKPLLNLCKLCLGVLLSLSLVPAYAQSQSNTTVTFSSKQVLIADIIDRLQSVYKFKVSYDADLNTARSITLPSTSLSLSDLLKQIERQASVGIRNNNGNLIIKRLQSVVLSGTLVSADDNQPLAGVTITDSKKRNYGVTSVNGNFSVRVEQGETISFSMVGYDSFTRPASRNESGIIIKLQPSNTSLNEVVVTALGIKREEKALGYAVTKIKSEQLTNAPSNNWTDALSGKVAGLNLIRSNGGPDGSNRIILRGESNLTGENDALIVVDGVVINHGSGRRVSNGNNAYLDGESPVDFGSGLNDLNPEDIEDVTVLKGPAAAALYGQRGANGALVITTKSGRVRKGIGVTINSNTSIEQISRWPDYQYEYGQGAAGENYYSFGNTADGASTRSTSSAWGPKFDGQSFFQYDPVTHTGGTTRTPWVAYPNARKNFFETGKTFTNSVTLDGGTDKTSVRFSATNLKNTWIIPNTGYTRNSIALSANQKTTDKLQISAKVNYTNRSSDNLPSTGYNNQSLMYWNMFWVPNGNSEWLKDYWLPGKENISQSYPFSSFPDNPYLITYQMLNKSNRNDLVGNVQATYNFTKDFSFMVRTALTMSYDQRSQQRPYDTEKFRKGMFRTQNIFSQEINNDFLLRYNKKVTKDFTATISAGGSMLANNYNQDETRADSLLYPGVFTLANSAGVLVALPNKQKYKINSFYGLFSANYKDYLFLDVTARNDWSSILASPTSTGNVSFFYPSASVSAIISDMVHLPKFITFAKLRGSIAGVGSGDQTPYLTSYTYSKPTTPFPGGLVNPTLVANPDLRPLFTKSYEIGADLRFFGSRLGIDIALYKSNTKDQILRNGVDPSSGYNEAVINAGNVENRGIEIQANGTPIKTRNGLSWTINGTFSANQNKVISLPDNMPLILQGGPANRGLVIAQVGGSMGSMYGLGYKRSPDGQIVYENGLPKLTDTSIYIGNTIPKWKASLGNQFRYKQFSFSFLVDAQYGAVGYSLTAAVLAEQGKTKNTLPGRYNGIIGNGVIQNPDGSFRPNDVVAQDVWSYYTAHYGRDNVEGATYSTDFIKLRESRLDYTLPTRLANKLGMQRLTVGVYGRDLLIITKWPAFDPEFGTITLNSQGNSTIARGFELGQFPSTRTFGFNLTIGL